MHVTLVLCMHEHVIGLSMLAHGLNRYFLHVCSWAVILFVHSFFEALRLCIVW